MYMFVRLFVRPIRSEDPGNFQKHNQKIDFVLQNFLLKRKKYFKKICHILAIWLS